MDEKSLVAAPGLRDGRGNVLNQMHHIFLNCNIFGHILWSQWETGLSLLSLKVHPGKAGGSLPMSVFDWGLWVGWVDWLGVSI